MKYFSIFICVLIVSCAGYKDIKPGSTEYYGLKTGDIIWVHTGTVTRKKVRFIKIEGDSIFADPYSFNVNSVTGIQKEYISKANTGIAVGGTGVVIVGLYVVAVVAIITFYAKLMTIF